MKTQVKIKIKKKMMFNKGDKVSVLDDAVDGIVISVKDQVVTIETTDGFVMNFTANELIKTGEADDLMENIKSMNINEIKTKEIANQEVL